MKVIFAYRWSFHYFRGGLEKYIFYLSRKLASINENIEIEVISSYQPYFSTGVSSNLKMTFLQPPVAKPVTISSYPFILSLAKYLLNKQFDVFHSFEVFALGYLLLSRKNRKIVLTQTPGFEPIGNMPYFNVIQKISNVPLAKSLIYCLENSDAVITLGPSFTRFLHERFDVPRSKIFELPNGIPFRLIRKVAQRPIVKRKDLGLNSDDFVLINVGSLTPIKGQEYLIRALSIVKNRLSEGFSRVKLLLVGSGPLERSLHQLIKKMALEKHIIRLKNLKEQELYSLYAISDIAVMPILDLSGPDLVILEAMAAGLPVITTNVWENPSVIKHGKNGYLVTPRNFRALAEAIIEAYMRRDKLHEMGMTSLKIVGKYDWSNIAKKAIEIYEQFVR
jgi:glycosyltransferase involved in cell wall biosynthesis